ncbi:MAG TPA: hypothetical protein VK887_07595 [Pseudonocardiaceae bacterium]|nr:hypothetical protein [Pseudonocardiaceae bacterium]
MGRAAYHWWRDAGRPGPQRWRISITPEGRQVTLTQAMSCELSVFVYQPAESVAALEV